MSEIQAHKGVIQKLKFIRVNNREMLVTCGSEDGCVSLIDLHSGMQTINSGTIHKTSINDVFQRQDNSSEI